MAKKKLTLEQRAKRTAITLGVIYGSKPLQRSILRQTTNKFVWTRPNGQKVQIRGYDHIPDHFHQTLSDIDSRLQDRHHLELRTITHKRPGVLMRKFKPEVMGYSNKHTKGITTYESEYQYFPSHTLTHEIAHTLDTEKQHSHARYGKAAGWKRNRRRTVSANRPNTPDQVLFGRMRAEAGHAQYVPTERFVGRYASGGKLPYQAHRAHEDFAETFAHGLRGKSPNFPGMDVGITYDLKRRKYMEQHFFKHGQPRVEADIKKVYWTGPVGKYASEHPKTAVAAGVGLYAAGVGTYYGIKHRKELEDKFHHAQNTFWRHTHKGKTVLVHRHH